MGASELAPISIPGTSTTKVSILGKETIVVGIDLVDHIARDVTTNIPASVYIIVTDTNIERLHLKTLVSALQNALDQNQTTTDAKARILSYVMPPGESSKTRRTKAAIEDWALQNKCTRDSCFIALGGGVIGDLVGFVAATFMRGVPVVQIPTTLLAMVDSSVGGKTAIDTPHGKNLIGSFHQPHRIFIDLRFLQTLPMREFVNGLGEIIKTAAIWVEEDFDLLENHPEQILALSQGAVDDPSSAEVQLLMRVILGSVRVKAHVVTVDEKEGGLRGLLNFGHSIGHAIEAILSPNLLHGECVALGMVREAEIARHLGYLNEVAVGRLVRCLQAYGLPVSLEDKIVKQRAPGKHCPVDKLLDIMCIDKKNQGSKKKIVMLSGIGRTYEPRASVIPDDVIRKILSPSVEITPPSKPINVQLKAPGSKSLSNRALVLAALGEGKCRLHGLLHSDDVQVMLDALQKLVGIEYQWENDGDTLVVTGGGGRLRVPSKEVYLGNAGTAARFLTTVCALIPKTGEKVASPASTIVTGNPRMKQRPIGPLVDALSANGVSVKYLETKGCLPLEITPNGIGLPGGRINLSASVSSQYVSSILISAPYAAQEVTLDLSGDAVISQLYIDMTIAMMASFGINVVRQEGTNMYTIPKGVYKNPADYYVEADASSATYPLAFAAITGSRVTVTNIGSDSLQGDAQFAVKVLREMGCTVEQTKTSTTVSGPAALKPLPTIDMEPMTDAFLTASVLAAVARGGPNKDHTTRITGIANQRVKECNRIAVMVEQLAKFGVSASELPDGIQIHGIDRAALRTPEGGVKCYDDHRVAMSFSVLACAMPGGKRAVVNEKRCVEKTWPAWWDALSNRLGVLISGVDVDVDGEEGDGHAVSSTKATNELHLRNLDETTPTALSDATIVLIGMRGAGKTHAGRAAAKYFGRAFIDMDHAFESDLNTTIPDFINTRGWEAFRTEEVRILSQTLAAHPTDTVIACGGGIVETADGRKVLTGWQAKHGCVVHIKRDITAIASHLDKDTTRPMYGEDMRGVWDRRKGWYRECSGYECVTVHQPDGTEEWGRVEKDFTRFLAFVTQRKSTRTLPGGVPNPPAPSFFISLTAPDVTPILPDLTAICAGADAIELRVDLLASHEEEYVGRQLALLRRYSPLPIVYTVRTQSQGGKFADADHDARVGLLECGVRWACEYVDVEVGCGDGSEVGLTQALVQRKGHSAVIASFHDVKGVVAWDDANVNMNVQRTSTHTGSTTFKAKYDDLAAVGDIVKLIGRAHSLEDNFALRRFVASLPGDKPVIALNMGPLGQISRALNTFLTPVTHPLLTTAAAPGQLSVKEIHQFRTLLGTLTPKAFYLFGKPIQQSVSPHLHNAGFEELGLPHHYQLYETDDVNEVVEVVRRGVAEGTFGGASVTIPLKEAVIKSGVVGMLTDAATRIGAVNTVGVGEGGEVWGDNTDWVGIVRCVRQAGVELGKQITANITGSSTSTTPAYALQTNPDVKTIGVVIGAGGTARAALYSLQHLHVDEIRVWNRTPEKAAALVEQFNGGVVVADLTALLATTPESGHTTRFIVVSTIPAAAQDAAAFTGMFRSLATSPSTVSEVTGVVIDMAYRPLYTPLLLAAQATEGLKKSWTVVPGLTVLVEQGVEQFGRWTGRRPPVEVMRGAASRGYEGV
ncbi:EPSP synthase-domain-containing protein [Fimicolochytrium jonesii]|uniref:EPSP synthase-domain-containing protein n=1 Tax=Fimicolochytrium jonesii TaxID=1396493 RepID=UPI0022FE3281|nr:EPSP synthase-domain-containing protein [Fimicolochytrium jonesii]KAI8826767.1 EPSP synthase-domain-containing protein [Fimicolochytrium jonesii]